MQSIDMICIDDENTSYPLKDTTGERGTIISSTGTISTANFAPSVNHNMCSLTISEGTWILFGDMTLTTTATVSRCVTNVMISTTISTTAVNKLINHVSKEEDYVDGSTSSSRELTLETSVIVAPTTTTTYYLNCWCGGNYTLEAPMGTLKGIRVR